AIPGLPIACCGAESGGSFAARGGSSHEGPVAVAIRFAGRQQPSSVSPVPELLPRQRPGGRGRAALLQCLFGGPLLRAWALARGRGRLCREDKSALARSAL